MNLLANISTNATVQLAIVVGLVIIVVMALATRSIAQGRRQQLAERQLSFEQGMAEKRFERELKALTVPAITAKGEGG